MMNGKNMDINAMRTNTYPSITVGILAGGKSTRMGENKALLRLEGERILKRHIKEFEGAYPVLISGAKKGLYEDFGAPVVYDEHKEIGPIEGIRRLLAESGSDYVFVLASDMPFVTKKLLSYIAEFISSDCDAYVITDEEHIQPLCAIYHKRILPDIEEVIEEGNFRIRELLKRVRTKYIPLTYSGFDKRTVQNINTREEYERIKRPAVFAVSGYSDSGKTFLIERLINEFIAHSYRVAVIKHDGHDRIKDARGTDTERFFKAGADYSLVYSETEYLLHAKERTSVSELIEMLRRKEPPPDILILEGFKASDYPKIWVAEGDPGEEDIPNPDTLICIATDDISPKAHNCPVYGRDDIREIFLCAERYFFGTF